MVYNVIMNLHYDIINFIDVLNHFIRCVGLTRKHSIFHFGRISHNRRISFRSRTTESASVHSFMHVCMFCDSCTPVYTSGRLTEESKQIHIFFKLCMWLLIVTEIIHVLITIISGFAVITLVEGTYCCNGLDQR